KHNSRRLAWGIGIGLALALAVGATLWRTHQQNSISYESVPVERGPIQAKVNATGNLNAVVDVLVSSQVSGNIKALYADWNSKVKKGQLVALIDPQIFQSQLDQASASYRSASAATISARAQVEKAKSDLSSAIASEKNAEAIAAKDLANEVNARSQWKRAEALLQEKIMNQQDYELAKANYAAARAQVTADRAQADAARQNILSAQASVRVAESQAATALAQEHEAQAVVKQARINLDHTRIMAPVDGTVIARRMDVGQTVASTLNPPTIFEIAQDLTKMQVDTNLDESDVGSIAKGQRAAFVVDSYPETTFEGVVADIRKAPIITQNVVTYDVVISVNNSEFKLFPGMTANVTIQTGRVEDTLKVPTSVLRFRPSAAVLKKTGLPPPQADKPQVYVLAAGKISAVPVKFGLTDGKYIAVRSDQLRPGERVVIRAIVQGSASSGASSAPPPMGPRM
ncbi:MAG TPA: efflux RND transporter periplasmic adaptor subunit, partial [Acidobacteriaceae bacterium]|nr:efflux RND transporter periplasmic adaptor subunit [Acidobacteriaceae bacterium]